MASSTKNEKPMRVPRCFRIVYIRDSNIPIQAKLITMYGLHKTPKKYFEQLKKEVMQIKIPYQAIEVVICEKLYLAKDIKSSSYKVFIEKMEILYEIFDFIIENNKNYLLHIDLTNFNHSITLNSLKIDLYHLIKNINFKTVRQIDLSYTYLNDEIITYLYNNFHNYNDLEDFQYHDVVCSKQGYFNLVKMYIERFYRFLFMATDKNVIKYYDELIDFVSNSYVTRIALNFDGDFSEKINNSMSMAEYSECAIKIKKLIYNQSEIIMDICYKLLSLNKTIKHVIIQALEDQREKIHFIQRFDTKKLLSIFKLIENDQILQTFEYRYRMMHDVAGFWLNIPKDNLLSLFNNNGNINLIGFVRINDEHFNLCYAHSFRNQENNEKRNCTLMELLFGYINDRDFYQIEKPQISIRKRNERTPKKDSRLKGYCKINTIKYAKKN